MAEKKAITVNDGHRVYVDPDHGVRLPRAEDLADRGVVTASERTIEAGETIDLDGQGVDQFTRAGVISR